MQYVFEVFQKYAVKTDLDRFNAILARVLNIEFSQLSQDQILVAARSNLLGRLILGNGFTGEDFPLYVLGSLVGWAWVIQLRRWVSLDFKC